MADVLIHRCTLRVIRRGGWSWGPDARRLVDDLVEALPELLARRLGALVQDEDDREWAAPIRIRLPIRLNELTQLGAFAADGSVRDETHSTASLEHRLDTALRVVLDLQQPDFPQPPVPPTPASGAPTGGGQGSRRAARADSASLQSLLRNWAKEGALERRLALLTEEQVSAWHRALWRVAPTPYMATRDEDTELAEQIDSLIRARVSTLDASEPALRLRYRLLVGAEIAARLDIPITHALLLRSLDAHITSPPEPQNTFPPAQDGARPKDDARQMRVQAATSQTRPATAEANTVAPASDPQPSWEVRIACALPFLLLNPLSRIGYFAALSAVLESGELESDATSFAAALALKVLEPPERGWRRSPNSILAASAFAGRHAAITENSIVDCARRIAPHTAALDLVLTDALISGHTAGQPVILLRPDPANPSGVLAVEVEGCFPLAFGEDAAPLVPILQRLDASAVLLSRELATPRMLRDLDAAGLSWIADIQPTRHERWQRIQQGTSWFGWTNSAAPRSERILSAARLLASASEAAEQLRQQLVVERPGVVRASTAHLDRSVTLAAGVGMGTLAWTLWRERGVTSPVLALERYADLEARIRFDDSSVLVTLPLGRRHRELLSAGLLAPVSNVPWLNGRRVEYRGG